MTNVPMIRMYECRRTRQRLQRFIDRDPAALLTVAEILEVEEHLLGCQKCTGLTNEYRALRKSLANLGAGFEPTDEAVDRVKQALDRALKEGPG
jgi:hypothetical protein